MQSNIDSTIHLLTKTNSSDNTAFTVHGPSNIHAESGASVSISPLTATYLEVNNFGGAITSEMKEKLQPEIERASKINLIASGSEGIRAENMAKITIDKTDTAMLRYNNQHSFSTAHINNQLQLTAKKATISKDYSSHNQVTGKKDAITDAINLIKQIYPSSDEIDADIKAFREEHLPRLAFLSNKEVNESDLSYVMELIFGLEASLPPDKRQYNQFSKNKAKAAVTMNSAQGFSSGLPPDYIEVDVPDRGDCLFWSAAFALLLPRLNNEVEFKNMYRRLFGTKTTIEINQKKYSVNDTDFTKRMRILLMTYDGEKDTPLQYEGKVLEKLICQIFRQCVIQNIEDNISLDDRKNIIAIDHKNDWELYKKLLLESGSWGGDPEIAAISRIAQVNILVYGSGHCPKYICDSSNETIYLIHTQVIKTAGAPNNHYHYGLPKKLYDQISRQNINQSKTDFGKDNDLGKATTSSASSFISTFSSQASYFIEPLQPGDKALIKTAKALLDKEYPAKDAVDDEEIKDYRQARLHFIDSFKKQLTKDDKDQINRFIKELGGEELSYDPPTDHKCYSEIKYY